MVILWLQYIWIILWYVVFVNQIMNVLLIQIWSFNDVYFMISRMIFYFWMILNGNHSMVTINLKIIRYVIFVNQIMNILLIEIRLESLIFQWCRDLDNDSLSWKILNDNYSLATVNLKYILCVFKSWIKSWMTWFYWMILCLWIILNGNHSVVTVNLKIILRHVIFVDQIMNVDIVSLIQVRLKFLIFQWFLFYDLDDSLSNREW